MTKLFSDLYFKRPWLNFPRAECQCVLSLKSPILGRKRHPVLSGVQRLPNLDQLMTHEIHSFLYTNFTDI